MYTTHAAMAVVSPLLLLVALLAVSSSPIIPAAAGNGEDDGYTLVALSSLKPKDGACFGHRGTYSRILFRSSECCALATSYSIADT